MTRLNSVWPTVRDHSQRLTAWHFVGKDGRIICFRKLELFDSLEILAYFDLPNKEEQTEWKTPTASQTCALLLAVTCCPSVIRTVPETLLLTTSAEKLRDSPADKWTVLTDRHEDNGPRGGYRLTV